METINGINITRVTVVNVNANATEQVKAETKRPSFYIWQFGMHSQNTDGCISLKFVPNVLNNNKLVLSHNNMPPNLRQAIIWT